MIVKPKAIIKSYNKRKPMITRLSTYPTTELGYFILIHAESIPVEGGGEGGERGGEREKESVNDTKLKKNRRENNKEERNRPMNKALLNTGFIT